LDLVLDHLLPLARIFHGFRIHVCFSTNSTGSGQDHQVAPLLIFRPVDGSREVLTAPAISATKEKYLDPLMKYDNNKTHIQWKWIIR
jgi:hypothetical protein